MTAEENVTNVTSVDVTFVTLLLKRPGDFEDFGVLFFFFFPVTA